MYFIAVKPFRRFGAVVVDYFAMSQVERGNCRHFGVVEAEVPDVEVFLDSLAVCRFRDNHAAVLGVPSQLNLCGLCFAPFFVRLSIAGIVFERQIAASAPDNNFFIKRLFVFPKYYRKASKK